MIEEQERARVQDEKDKARRKSGSGKHVQKDGVIYKGRGVKQSMETNKEYDDWRANTRNTKLTRIVREKDKIWTKVIKELPKYAREFREEFGLIMDE